MRELREIEVAVDLSAITGSNGFSSEDYPYSESGSKNVKLTNDDNTGKNSSYHGYDGGSVQDYKDVEINPSEPDDSVSSGREEYGSNRWRHVCRRKWKILFVLGCILVCAVCTLIGLSVRDGKDVNSNAVVTV